jgi:hypothetical protein
MASENISPARRQRRRAAGDRHDDADVRSGIWVVHAMQDPRRIALLGDLRHEHFYYTEGDPSVDRVDYWVPRVTTTLDREGDRPISFDAIVTRIDGNRECRRVASRNLDQSVEADAHLLERLGAAARRHGGKLIEVTPEQLDQHATRVWNWVRVMGAYKRARDHSLAVVEASVVARISSGVARNVGELLIALPSDAPALILASLAKLLRQRRLCSDLDRATWSRSTKVWEAPK